jgi:uncharacterized protein YbjQ (UPF0145 family)
VHSARTGAKLSAEKRREVDGKRWIRTGIEEFGGGKNGTSDILIVTTNDVPGQRVERVIGEVFGPTVRSRHPGSQTGAGLKSLVGGELRGLTKTPVETRGQAGERLTEQARARGANAVPAMRFDVAGAVDVGTEVCAYGTAVVLRPE